MRFVPAPTAIEWVDQIIPGGLEKWLRRQRRDGSSYRAIATSLHDLHQLDFSDVTVFNWCRKFGID